MDTLHFILLASVVSLLATAVTFIILWVRKSCETSAVNPMESTAVTHNKDAVTPLLIKDCMVLCPGNVELYIRTYLPRSLYDSSEWRHMRFLYHIYHEWNDALIWSTLDAVIFIQDVPQEAFDYLTRHPTIEKWLFNIEPQTSSDSAPGISMPSWDIVKRADDWGWIDYSATNLQTILPKPGKLVLPSPPCLTKETSPPVIRHLSVIPKLVMMGETTERRAHIIARVAEWGYTIEPRFGVFDTHAKDDMLRSFDVIINIHSYENRSVFEELRLAEILASRIPMISEGPPPPNWDVHPYRHVVKFYDSLEELNKLLYDLPLFYQEWTSDINVKMYTLCSPP